MGPAKRRAGLVQRCGEPLPDWYRERLRQIAGMLAQEYGDLRGRVTLVREPRVFDWDTGRITSLGRHVIGTLEVGAMALSANGD